MCGFAKPPPRPSGFLLPHRFHRVWLVSFFISPRGFLSRRCLFAMDGSDVALSEARSRSDTKLEIPIHKIPRMLRRTRTSLLTRSCQHGPRLRTPLPLRMIATRCSIRGRSHDSKLSSTRGALPNHWLPLVTITTPTQPRLASLSPILVTGCTNPGPRANSRLAWRRA